MYKCLLLHQNIVKSAYNRIALSHQETVNLETTDSKMKFNPHTNKKISKREDLNKILFLK